LPLRERKLISRIRQKTRRRRPPFSEEEVIAGVGDDCSVLRIPAGQDVLVTTDYSLEGVHFRRAWHSAEVVGHRCLARGLSDIAAMGGEPVAAFLSLALPKKLSQSWVDGFFRGLLRLAKKFKVELAGGDTAQSSDGVLADIVVVGSVPKGRAVLRSGARPGDGVYVTGELGGSAAALARLSARPRQKLNPAFYVQHFHPMPRIEIGGILRRNRVASAMIDISDGLSTDLSHICEESGVGAEIIESALPLAQVGQPRRKVNPRQALHGGEDYELLFTSSRPIPAEIAGVKISEIGRITRRKQVLILDSRGRRRKLAASGWEHFRL
jgi:thiamine-monophosphate kinase